MSGHTPGQWTVGHAGFERVPVVVAKRAGRPATVAQCDGGNRDEDEANARLIAAAPDLLAALPEPHRLIALADFLDRHDDELFGSGFGDRKVQSDLRASAEKIRAAIAKATGGQ